MVEEDLVILGWLLMLNLLNPIGDKPFIRYKAVKTPAIAELKLQTILSNTFCFGALRGESEQTQQ